MSVLITGGAGFVGRALTGHLRARGHDVHAPDVDVLDSDALRALVRSGSWRTVVHLAAISSTGACQADPALAYRVNLAGTATVLECLQEIESTAHFVFPSTGYVYAPPSEAEAERELVIDEERPTGPTTVYGRTKWAAELIIRDAIVRAPRPATIFRIFNHSHRSQSDDFYLPHVYRSLVAAASGEAAPRIEVGNIDIRRDIGALQDLLHAFTVVIEEPPGGYALFNLCGGQPRLLRDLAMGLAHRLGVQVDLQVNPERVRPGEARFVVGSNARLVAATAWRPTVTSNDELLDAFLTAPDHELAS